MKNKLLTPVLFLFVFLCFLLQGTLFKTLSFGGISPNLLIITTCSIALMRGEYHGLLAGFFSGLLVDIFFGGLIGAYALFYMYFGFLAGKFSRVFYPEDLKLPMGLIALSDLSYGLICYVFMFMLQGRFHFQYYFAHIIVPEMIYTLLVSIVIYPIVLFFYKKLHVEE